MKISKILPVAAAFLVLAWPVATPAQTGDDAAAKNAKQAKKAIVSFSTRPSRDILFLFKSTLNRFNWSR